MNSKTFFPILFCLFLLVSGPAIQLFGASGDAGRTKQLIETLQSPSADLHAKARACQQAGEFGTAEVIPALAALLGDEKLAAYARSGLENIPDPAAAAALRSALGTLKGSQLIGVVNSLGVLRDEKAAGALRPFAADPSKGAAKEALLALGRISTSESIAFLREALQKGSVEFRAGAASACLLAAERQWAAGKPDTAMSIYDDLRATDLQKPLRAAALRGAMLTRGKDGLPLLLENLRSPDADVRNIALGVARELPGGQVSAALTTELGRAKPDLQEQLIGVLVDRGDAQVLQPIESLAASHSLEVRLAVIKALAKIGASSSVPLLLQSAVSKDEVEPAAALDSLAQIKAEGVHAAILQRLPAMEPKLRARLINVLGERNATEAIPSVLAQAADPDAEVATAAFKTLAAMARPEDQAQLLPLALVAPEGPVRSQAERAVYLTALRVSAAHRVDPILNALRTEANATGKKTLIRMLGLLGTQPACAAVQGALQDVDESVKEAAFRALVDWPDASAMPALLTTIQGNATPTHRALALRGAIRIATREYSSSQAPAWFQQLNQAVTSPAEKKLIIPGLSQLAEEHAAGLQMLQSYLEDPVVAPEAATAVVQKGSALVKGKSRLRETGLLKALLERVAAGSGSKGLRDEAASLAKQLPGKTAAPAGASLNFRPLFNGRNFEGWEGDTAKSFRIVDGAIVGGNLQAPVPRNEFLTTTRRYANFVLRAECKLLGTSCNGGIQLRSERIPHHHEMMGYQADMSTGDKAGYWGKLYDESRRKRVLSEDVNREPLAQSLQPDGWNQYEIRCEGPRIRLSVNGVLTADYTEIDPSIPLTGLIAVQIHGGKPSEAWYRNLSIAELP